MSVSPPLARRLVHTRLVHFEGYAREDGLYDIEARLIDTKPEPLTIEGEGRWEAGAPIHGMLIRLSIDGDYIVRAVEVRMDHMPHGECEAARAPMQSVVGCSLRKGWRAAIEERLGKVRGCAHLRELLFNMGTVAFQSLAPWTQGQRGEQPPAALGGCLAWDPRGPMVARIYPRFHIKPDA
ncbi:MAG: DUF2889 domain-containing protein [Betaproteobacteria bacterium]|nr:DUF2889 domain-containing protein [Betaproteobacteria bacterium]